MKKIQLCILLLFLLCPLGLSIVTLAGGDRAFSENENRTLKRTADISGDLLTGAFQEDLTDCLSDQFPGRDRLTALSAGIAYVLGRRELGDTYIGEGCRLFQKYTESGLDRASNLKYIGKLEKLTAETGVPVLVAPVPSAGCALPDLLPAHAQMYDYEELVDQYEQAAPSVHFIRLAHLLTDPDDYYLTDHHWTTRGAYRAYAEIIGEVPSYDSLEPVLVTDSFRGSLYSRVLLDRIPCDQVFLVREPEGLTVTADGKPGSLYDMAALNRKDVYTVFQGGNYGILTVDNPNAERDDCLLILKDSFCNALLPFLCKEYSRIVMIDERYTFAGLAELVSEYQADTVLVVKEACNLG